jgi:hypothetical protein
MAPASSLPPPLQVAKAFLPRKYEFKTFMTMELI